MTPHTRRVVTVCRCMGPENQRIEGVSPPWYRANALEPTKLFPICPVSGFSSRHCKLDPFLLGDHMKPESPDETDAETFERWHAARGDCQEDTDAWEKELRDDQYRQRITQLEAEFHREVHSAKPLLDFAGLLVLQAATAAVLIAAISNTSISAERRVLIAFVALVFWWHANSRVAQSTGTLALLGVYKLRQHFDWPFPSQPRSATFRAIYTATAFLFYGIAAIGTGAVGYELAKIGETLAASKEVKASASNEKTAKTPPARTEGWPM